MTLDDLESDKVFSAAVMGLPKILELIAAIPEERRSLAFEAAQQSYLRTAQTVGYDEATLSNGHQRSCHYWRSQP
jgi:hypothetical protein